MRRAWALWVGLGLSACPREEPAASDHTIEKLKAEQRRLIEGGRPGRPPADATEALSRALAAPASPRALPVPPGQARAGPLTVEVRSALASQSVVGSQTSLSSAERFLKVVLVATSAERVALELSTATLQREEETAAVARDAQRVGQGSPLTTIAIEPGVRQELVLYFEVPPSMLAPGLKMILSPHGSRLELPLE